MSTRPVRTVEVPVEADALVGFHRADLVVDNLDQAGPSYELRVFLNQPDADLNTVPIPEYGYAGSIHIFGYGRPAMVGQPELPMSRSLEDSAELGRALRSERAVLVTLVPVWRDDYADIDLSAATVHVDLS